jgi:putative membrane protein
MAALATAAPAVAQSSNSNTNSTDTLFVSQAAQAGMAEVADAKLALGKTTDPSVKAFAQRMIDDHSKANDQLESIAREDSLALPSGVGTANSDMHAKLEGLDGKAFDSAYLMGQRKAHEQAIALFQKEAQAGSNPQLVAFAKKTLPTLQEHLSMDEKDITAMTKGSNSGGM